MSEYRTPSPYVELAVGGELRIPYKGDDESTMIVIGRNPVTESVREEEKRADDLRVKISGAGSDFSRRALELNVDGKNVTIKNLGSQKTQWRTDPRGQWRELSRNDSAKLRNSIDDMRNFEVQIGRFLIKSGAVGGKEKALQSLILK